MAGGGTAMSELLAALPEERGIREPPPSGSALAGEPRRVRPARGLATGVIGTIQYVLGDETRPAGQTTPEALDLQSMLAHMRDGGVRGVAMEASSHALALARADGLAFDVAVFTNLTQDHLDFHGTLESYRLPKPPVFDVLPRFPQPTPTPPLNGGGPAGAAVWRGGHL